MPSRNILETARIGQALNEGVLRGRIVSEVIGMSSVWRIAFVAGMSSCVLVVLTLEVSGEQRRGSISIGTSAKGKLLNPSRLPDEGTGFYSNPKRPNGTAVWGTDEMVAALVKAGSDVERGAPGATLFINDIGFFEGGRIPHHLSHQAGRDADLLFYAFNGKGKSVDPECIPFDGDGRAVWDNETPDDETDDEARRFDVHRNWLAVRSLVENEEARVQRIFVAEHIRALLLDHAREVGQPAWIIERAGDVMCQPGPPHDDHFHIRIFCSVDDYRRGCRDRWPLYPWRRTELALSGLTNPVLARPSKRRRRRSSGKSSPPPGRRKGRLWCP